MHRARRANAPGTEGREDVLYFVMLRSLKCFSHAAKRHASVN